MGPLPAIVVRLFETGRRALRALRCSTPIALRRLALDPLRYAKDHDTTPIARGYFIL